MSFFFSSLYIKQVIEPGTSYRGGERDEKTKYETERNLQCIYIDIYREKTQFNFILRISSSSTCVLIYKDSAV